MIHACSHALSRASVGMDLLSSSDLSTVAIVAGAVAVSMVVAIVVLALVHRRLPRIKWGRFSLDFPARDDR